MGRSRNNNSNRVYLLSMLTLSTDQWVSPKFRALGWNSSGQLSCMQRGRLQPVTGEGLYSCEVGTCHLTKLEGAFFSREKFLRWSSILLALPESGHSMGRSLTAGTLTGRWQSSGIDRTLARLLWALFPARPHPWPINLNTSGVSNSSKPHSSHDPWTP